MEGVRTTRVQADVSEDLVHRMRVMAVTRKQTFPDLVRQALGEFMAREEAKPQ